MTENNKRSHITKSVSYLDLFLEIDQEGRLLSKINDKQYHFDLPIVQFP